MNIPKHLRANHEATEAALIRFNGLACALEIVADEIPEGAPKSAPHWRAFYALVNELVDKNDLIDHLRSMEWAGLGGNNGLSESEVRRARGEAIDGPVREG